MNVGDLVFSRFHGMHEENGIGIIIETGINMWGEDVIPSGVSVIWSKTSECETVYEDEVVIANEYKIC